MSQPTLAGHSFSIIQFSPTPLQADLAIARRAGCDGNWATQQAAHAEPFQILTWERAATEDAAKTLILTTYPQLLTAYTGTLASLVTSGNVTWSNLQLLDVRFPDGSPKLKGQVSSAYGSGLWVVRAVWTGLFAS